MKRRHVTAGTMMMMVVAITAAAIACTGKLPSPAPSPCGDQCVSSTCPAGSHCVLNSRCTPICELETLTRPR